MFAVSGAQGGAGAGVFHAGGLGGSATATISVTPGQVIQINVGCQGGAAFSAGGTGLGGFNGGGDGGVLAGDHFAGGGGGASDVRQNGTAPANRVIVAGGGGGFFGGGGGDGDGNQSSGGGGGGSGFGPVGGVAFQSGVRAGGGLITITFTIATPTSLVVAPRFTG